MTNLPEVIICTCGASCDWEDTGKPCYGKIEAIEELRSDDDFYWMHACEGHQNMYENKGYIPFEEKA